MFEIKLEGDFQIKQADLYEHSLDKLLSVDCWMIIKIKNNVFYNDWVCPLEFFAQYKKWKDENGLNAKITFEYNTEDNSDNPILTFVWSESKKLWFIDSCFKKYTHNTGFSDENLNQFFKQFEDELNTHIMHK